jgi:hypothetical protein
MLVGCPHDVPWDAVYDSKDHSEMGAMDYFTSSTTASTNSCSSSQPETPTHRSLRPRLAFDTFRSCDERQFVNLSLRWDYALHAVSEKYQKQMGQGEE